SVMVLPALFLAYLQLWHRGELPHTYQDQAMNAEVAHAICSAPDPVVAFAADPALWGEMAGSKALSDALAIAYNRVQDFLADNQLQAA
ncbi:MAG: mannitol dehydrogenase family protein, partial [Burkholderiaceae bacterium]|nr:mannitol dehydrogenase family protein [Burkholderiaceae bacterium]